MEPLDRGAGLAETGPDADAELPLTTGAGAEQPAAIPATARETTRNLVKLAGACWRPGNFGGVPLVITRPFCHAAHRPLRRTASLGSALGRAMERAMGRAIGRPTPMTLSHASIQVPLPGHDSEGVPWTAIQASAPRSRRRADEFSRGGIHPNGLVTCTIDYDFPFRIRSVALVVVLR